MEWVFGFWMLWQSEWKFIATIDAGHPEAQSLCDRWNNGTDQVCLSIIKV